MILLLDCMPWMLKHPTGARAPLFGRYCWYKFNWCDETWKHPMTIWIIPNWMTRGWIIHVASTPIWLRWSSCSSLAVLYCTIQDGESWCLIIYTLPKQQNIGACSCKRSVASGIYKSSAFSCDVGGILLNGNHVSTRWCRPRADPFLQPYSVLL